MMQRQYGPVPTQGELFLAMNSQGTIMQVFGYFNNNSGAYVCYPPSSVGTSLLKKYGMTFDDTDGLNRRRFHGQHSGSQCDCALLF